MEKLFTLLDLQRQAQEASSLHAFAHISVNGTRQLIPYDEALVWTRQGSFITFQEAAGNAVLDDKAPFAQGVKIILKQAIDILNPHQTAFHVPASAMETYLERRGGDAMVLMFRGRDKTISGGLWLYREKSFTSAEEEILAELSHGYGVALELIQRTASVPWSGVFNNITRTRKMVLVACAVLAFWPVRLSVSAPAEIIARDARVISVPFDGVVEEILVSPGESVAAGQEIARMEQTALRARMELAQETLSTAQTTLSRLRRDALGNPDKRIEMTALQSDIAIKKLEYDYAESLLRRAGLAAPRDGVAVFSDKNTLVGKPARTGDILMQIANPAEKELLIRIPADALIPLTSESRVSFHLNVSPLLRHDARIVTIGYQASPDPDGLLTYKVRASINGEDDDMRIGWKGNATLKGDWTVLSYALARRPIASLRRMIGM